MGHDFLENLQEQDEFAPPAAVLDLKALTDLIFPFRTSYL